MNSVSPARVALDALRVRTCVGLTAEERSRPQELVCTCTVSLPTTYHPEHDEIDKTVDYGELARLIRSVAAATETKLLERLAWELGRAILDRFQAAETVTVGLIKTGRIPRCNGARVEIPVSREHPRGTHQQAAV